MFAVVPLGVSCFVSCRVGSGGYFCGPLERWGAGQVVSSRHSAAGGRRAMRARLVFWRSGASGMGANAVS